MKPRSAFIRSLALLAVGVAIAGCDTWSYNPPMRGNFYSYHVTLPHVQTAAGQPDPSVSPFNQALTREYASFANSLITKDGDRADADYFSRKGMAAAHGAVVPPESDSNWAIVTPVGATADNRLLLQDGRRRLLAALDGGARDKQPQLAASTQVDYDCWVEHMEQSWWTALDGYCHRDFLAKLNLLEGGAPAGAERIQFRVYFEFDKSALTPEALQILKKTGDDAKGDPKLRIMLVGKADRAGTDAYNMGLSHRRADAVRAELQRLGVDNTRIDERWVGEREPPVPTPDGVREPRNRVVEITIR